MNKTLYFECYAGISGDMAVAALLDLGAEEKVLLQALQSLPLDGYHIEIRRVKKAGLDACDFCVKLDSAHENHDHDMKYLHGHEHGLQESAEGHGHSHEHRGLPEIIALIEESRITENAKAMAKRIFEILAHAEAKAHGVSVEQVHFHEVGAVDSIVDIVAVAVCIDNLGIEKVIIPVLYEGTGTVRCQHGILPVPVPAAANIIKEYDLPVRMTEVHGELVTPTGAAIAAALRTADTLPEQFTIQKIGIGAGKRQYERPSLLRAMLISGESISTAADTIYKLETDIDDCTGEELGYVLERLFEAGARDVHYIPVFMKKNRPAYQLNVICTESQMEQMENIIFQETTTIGIRRISMERTILEREPTCVRTKWGEVAVKRCTLPDGSIRCYPEYDSISKIAKEQGVSIREVMDSVVAFLSK